MSLRRVRMTSFVHGRRASDMANSTRKASTSSPSSSSMASNRPDEHAPLSFQSDELSRASLAQSDFDFAYQLQLQEALAASCADNPPSPLHPPSPEDRTLAFALQNLEVSRGEQEELDQLCARREAEMLRLELKRRAHDAKFAKYLEEVDDCDWDSHGDNCEDLFRQDNEGSDDESSPYMLYCTSASSGNGMIAGTPSAIGAVVVDSRGNVLTELRKGLDLGTGKTAADYMALVAGLETVRLMGLAHVEAHTDSVIVYNQVMRRWIVRSRKFKGLLSQVWEHARRLQTFHLTLMPRSKNVLAMRLAREAVNLQLDEGNATNDADDGTRQVCTICLEQKLQKEIFRVSQCSHEFCRSCVIQHAQVKVQDGKIPVQCPQVGCNQTLSPVECKSILSQQWYELLNKRLIELNIPESERVYCPFPKCSALMDRGALDAIKKCTYQEACTSSSHSMTSMVCTECVECHQFFCVDCRAPWHSSMTCQAYQQLPSALKDAQDAKLYQLAENQKWQRCKKCRRMIELGEGCYHMTCRCGYEFCYLCGEPWKNKRQTCKCRLWDEDYLLDEPISESDELSDDYSEDFDDDSDFDDFNQMTRMANFHFGSDPVRLNNGFYKTKLCRYWERGNCYDGEHCTFAHGVHELR